MSVEKFTIADTETTVSFLPENHFLFSLASCIAWLLKKEEIVYLFVNTT